MPETRFIAQNAHSKHSNRSKRLQIAPEPSVRYLQPVAYLHTFCGAALNGGRN